MHSPPLILIVDDEADTIALLKRVCHRAGFESVVAQDGYAALSMAHLMTPDLILLDIHMPNLSGFEVMERLRQTAETAFIPIIVITAAATTPEDAAHGLNLGADDYITKPFNYQELAARIRAKIRAKSLEESLQGRTQELEMLVQLGIRLNHPTSLQEQVAVILGFLHEHLFPSLLLLYIQPKEQKPGLSFLQREKEALQVLAKHPLAKVPEKLAGIPLEADSLGLIYPEMLLGSGLLLDLAYQNAPLGRLLIAYEQTGAVNPDLQRLMASVAQHITLAITNAQLYESLEAYTSELETRVEERTKALQQAQEQLLRAEKLAALGRLSGEIAHEINNPLQPIILLLEEATENDKLDPETQEHLSLALQEAHRLRRTVQRLLNFARPDTSQLSYVDPVELLGEVLALTQKKMEHTGVRLVTRLEQVSAIYANPDQLKQVFLNMTLNALDSMLDKSRGVIEVELSEREGKIWIKIRDNGKGIPPNILNQIFEPFFSTKEMGSGLGLAISHSLVEAHGGSIYVESQLERGTCFSVVLPVAPP
jgi:signal transduction histidine kinase